MKIEPVAGALGALITGVDLADLSDTDFAAIRGAWLEHQVVFFRAQPWTPAQHAAFADRLGPPQRHEAYPHVDGFNQLTILENDREHPPTIEMWHTDMTFRASPPLGSILHSVVAPERGGDTLFASMSAAWDGLSPHWQRFLLELEAVHDFAHGFKESLEAPGGRERLADMLADNPPVTHPVVIEHPETGRRGLYVNSLFTREIVGMSAPESAVVLRFLFEHVTMPEYTCRFRWEAGSVAFWDNRITQHKPVNDYWPQHRRMQRITVDQAAGN
tara:strand:- start:1950 stop:2768 length:819 start_codon:yes stop_codon:yes gene_type:complete